jgi:hypothetical protein
VYATYNPNKVYSYQITLVISKENNEVTIKSSRGISYAYYDKVLDYAKKKGCITGEEDDFQLEEIIKEKRLRSNLDIRTNLRLQQLYDNLDTRSNLNEYFGSISGSVTITNKNNFNFEYVDLNLKVNFYDSSDIISSTEKVYLFNGVNASSSATGMVSSAINNSVRYKVITDMNITDELKSRVKDLIISEENYNCN